MTPRDDTPITPEHIDLKKDRGLTVRWSDGSTSYYPIAYLRRMSPSAEQRELRERMGRDPLTILPEGRSGTGSGDVVATGAELVGNYAIKILFSDGHETGLYTWEYLRKIDPERGDGDPHAGRSPHADPLGLGPEGDG